MTSHKDSICGIEIGKNLITVAQYSPVENAIGSIVVKPFDEAVADNDDTVLNNELKDLIADVELKKQKIVLSLPSEFAVIKKLSIDSNEHDVTEAILWEFSQHIIGTIEEYSFDFEPLQGGDRAGIREYIAVAYRTSSIQKLTMLLKANKLNPFIVDLDCFALVNAFEANYGELLSLPSIIILGTEKKSKIVLTRKGSLVDFEVVTYEDGCASHDDYATLIGEYLAPLCARLNGEIPEIYCSGSLFLQTECIDSLARKFGKAELLNPFRKVECLALREKHEVTKFSAQLAVAVGLALRGKIEEF
jgi:Tfp pilus assembly PilM family ATPase